MKCTMRFNCIASSTSHHISSSKSKKCLFPHSVFDYLCNIVATTIDCNMRCTWERGILCASLQIHRCCIHSLIIEVRPFPQPCHIFLLEIKTVSAHVFCHAISKCSSAFGTLAWQFNCATQYMLVCSEVTCCACSLYDEILTKGMLHSWLSKRPLPFSEKEGKMASKFMSQAGATFQRTNNPRRWKSAILIAHTIVRTLFQSPQALSRVSKM